ncbi:MAG: hypothetical protein WBR26_22230 [Candidatus Acidiferrum sp.]
MPTSNLRPPTYAKPRRSQRILLSVPILVTGQHSGGAMFSEQTKTQVVNAHGAMILLRERVVVGQKLKIRHLSTSEEASCTVMDINNGSADIPEVGVAFAQPCAQFWRVFFPPEDWSPHIPEAKRISFGDGPAKTILSEK